MYPTHLQTTAPLPLTIAEGMRFPYLAEPAQSLRPLTMERSIASRRSLSQVWAVTVAILVRLITVAPYRPPVVQLNLLATATLARSLIVVP